MRIKLPLEWRYNLRTGPLLYSESDPTLYGLLPLGDFLIRRISGNRYAAKNPLLHHHNCSECGIEFWSSRETEGFCKRRNCFMSYHAKINQLAVLAGLVAFKAMYGGKEDEENKADQQAHI